MRVTAATATIIGGLFLSWGCGNKPGEGDVKPAPTAAVPPSAVKAAAPTATATVASTATSSSAAAVEAPALPAGRTPAPTLDEWDKMKKEVTVKGSSALKCETKIVREYLRVNCKGTLEPEGTPTGIKILKGGRGEAMAYAHAGVTSLILPFVEGTDFEAVFSWTHKSHKLVVSWPRGNKLPVIVGAFEGAASPLDGNSRGDDGKLCACYKEVTGLGTCEDMIGAADADCDRTYAGDCNKLLACSRGESSALPRCQPGYINVGATGHCSKLCGKGIGPCPEGTSCINFFGKDLCLD